MAFRTLHLIATGYIATQDELQDTLTIDLHSLSYDRRNQPLDLYTPIEACRCLLTHDSGVIRFAHYTVKECLVSPRML
jgi:hypothetical protein